MDPGACYPRLISLPTYEVTIEELDVTTRTHAEIFRIIRAIALVVAFPKLECKGHLYLETKHYERLDKKGDDSPPGRWIRAPPWQNR